MFLSDLRYGTRMLLKRPGFSLVAVLLLALGIGANTTIFRWVEHFVLEPIPGVARASELVSVHGTTLTRRDISYSYPNFADTRARRPDGLVDLAGLRPVALNVRVGRGEPERAWAELVTANYFTLLGVSAHLGRVLVDDDDRAPGVSPVVVLSYRYWRNRFGGDPDAVGSTLTVNGRPFTVVGVAPAGFRGSTSAMSMDLWVPMMMQAVVMAGDRLTQRGNAWMAVIGRLEPDATIDEAAAGLSRVAAELAAEFPEVNEDRGAAAYPLWRDPQSPASILAPVMGVLLVVAALVLLVVCANLANLLLARASGRQREVAVRLALGASRTRVVRQLLTESVLLALAGGAGGFLVALWARQLVARFVPPTPLPIATDVPFDPTMAIYSFALAAGTTVLFGLAPALQASRPTLMPALRDVRTVIGSRRVWLRHALVIAQVATSIVLLVGAGLFIRTLQQVQDVDLGFDLEDGMIASLDLLPGGYDAERGGALFRQLLTEVEALPGVASAAIIRDMPVKMGGGSDTTADVEGYEPAEGEEMTIFYDRVSPGTFETLGIRVIAGRTFADTDDGSGPPVVVVNETMARRYWPDGRALGGRIRLGEWATVIGVVADVKYTTLSAPPVAYMYLPLYGWYRPDVTLVVRTAGPAASVFGPVRDRLRRLDPNLPLFDVRSVAEHKDMAVFMPRLAATLLGLFGSLALVLATLGLYGLLAFHVGQRTQEIGIRIALGAPRDAIRALVIRQGLGLTAIGALIGFGVCLLAFPLVSSQLVGVSARDGLSYGATSLLLLVGAAAASYLPARRASSIDPIRALRYE